MSLLLTAAVVAATAAAPGCSWDQPGLRPLSGDVARTIEHFEDIPAQARAMLRARVAAGKPDDLVVIRRDSIAGRQRYQSDIRDMHFGGDRVCPTISREHWPAERTELGVVFCQGDQCLLVTVVGHNVGRIDRLPEASAANPPERVAAAQASGGGGTGLGTEGELEFEPPGAGANDANDANGAGGGGGFGEGSFESRSQPGGAGGGGGSGLPALPPLFSQDAPLSVGLPPLPTLPAPLTPVPEPARALLMLGGLGLLAWFGRWRRRGLRG